MNERPEEQIVAMANDMYSLFKRDLNDTELVMCVEHGLPLFGVGTSVAVVGDPGDFVVDRIIWGLEFGRWCYAPAEGTLFVSEVNISLK